MNLKLELISIFFHIIFIVIPYRPDGGKHHILSKESNESIPLSELTPIAIYHAFLGSQLKKYYNYQEDPLYLHYPNRGAELREFIFVVRQA